MFKHINSKSTLINDLKHIFLFQWSTIHDLILLIACPLGSININFKKHTYSRNNKKQSQN